MKKPMNQHHYLENVTMALNAMKKDDIKLVNIGMYNLLLFLLKIGLLMQCPVNFQVEVQLQLCPFDV